MLWENLPPDTLPVNPSKLPTQHYKMLEKQSVSKRIFGIDS
jgi:hypothetical protein